ncbi:hypothetical protein N7582_005345 [Saccharomyces uvarum]|uniref:Sporulation-specific protein 12 n=1 Tax=Saccharomyces uvarum TaxID=230603 RepID=A0AA35J9M5_SACUV|nr:hypothetical protein N7582_005345 [Saccharomyces uvarum]CAI4052024.1 hypothetical protein SUVC_15G3110 [Saccharomyces uvarum]
MSSKTSDQSAYTVSFLKTDITRNNTTTTDNDNGNNNNNSNNSNNASAKTKKDANKENIPGLEGEMTAFRIFKKRSTSSLKTSHTTSSSLIKKTIFKKDVLRQDPKRKLQLQQRFASPTDRLVSPCSLKLNEHKVKMFGKKQKVNPMKLNFKGHLEADSEDVEIDEDEEFFY